MSMQEMKPVLGVYTLGGQKVKDQAEDLQDLPQGIYIINGKKMVVK